MTKQPKNQKNMNPKVLFEPNIWSKLHLVNFNVLIEKVEKFILQFSVLPPNKHEKTTHLHYLQNTWVQFKTDLTIYFFNC